VVETIEIGRYEAPPRKSIRNWLLARPELVLQIEEYVKQGGTIAAVYRWLCEEKGFKGSHSRLDAVLFGTTEAPGLLQRPQRG